MDRPEGNPTLRQISASDIQVWAVDSQDRLYRRKDIVSILPEGTSWELIDEHVLHVSVGKHDQVSFGFSRSEGTSIMTNFFRFGLCWI